MMLRIAFVYPPFHHVENQPNIEIVDANYGIYPPLSLAQAAAVVKQAGHVAALIDAPAMRLRREQIIETLRKFRPDMLAFGISTYNFHDTLEWIKFIRNNLKKPVVVGGQHMRLYAKETMDYPQIDFGIIGEAERVIPDFLSEFEHKKNFFRIRGLAFRSKNEMHLNMNAPLTEDIDSAPFPARELLPNERYYSLLTIRKNFTCIITSRGCPYSCSFCEERLEKYRRRSPENVLLEIKECCSKYKIREFDFVDALFTLDKKRAIDICKLLIREKLDIVWSIKSRADTVDKELLIWLKQAGCIRIFYGIESGNQQILNAMNKNITIKKIRDTIELTNSVGIESYGYFMLGCPGENKKTIRQTVDFALSLPLDYAQFSKFSSLPGTGFYESWSEEFGDYWKDYIISGKKEESLRRLDCSLSEKELTECVMDAYKQFYFRPKQTIRLLGKLGTLSRFFRFIKVAASMLNH